MIALIDTQLILDWVKARLGITSTVRDAYLQAVVEGVIDELTKEKGIRLNPDNKHHLMFVVDYAAWRYQSASDTSTSPASLPMPRHLQYRLRNLIISSVAGSGEDGNV